MRLRSVTIETVHEELIRANLDGTLTTEDALLWMALLHTHEIHFRLSLLSDRPSVMSVAPITRNEVAEVMAALWRGRKNVERASSTFWLHEYAEKAGWECIEDIPAEKANRLQELRDQLATDPRILKVVGNF
jgi:hypothetical protein